MKLNQTTQVRHQEVLPASAAALPVSQTGQTRLQARSAAEKNHDLAARDDDTGACVRRGKGVGGGVGSPPTAPAGRSTADGPTAPLPPPPQNGPTTPSGRGSGGEKGLEELEGRGGGQKKEGAREGKGAAGRWGISA